MKPFKSIFTLILFSVLAFTVSSGFSKHVCNSYRTLTDSARSVRQNFLNENRDNVYSNFTFRHNNKVLSNVPTVDWSDRNGFCNLVFSPVNPIKWNDYIKNVASKSLETFKIFKNTASRKEFKIYSFLINGPDLQPEDRAPGGWGPKFPCTVEVYLLKGKNWILIKKKPVKSWLELSELKTQVLFSDLKP